MHLKTPLKRIKSKAFTLLELMVCLAIIGLLGAVLGIKGVDLLAHHRFHSSLQTWLFDVQRLQILAMNQGIDVVCRFKKDPNENFFKVTLESDSPHFHTSSYDLKEVSALTFQNKPIKDELEVIFYSSGRIAPDGILKIGPKRETQDPLFLDFSYPIAFQTKLVKKKAFAFSPPPYPEKAS